MEPAAVNSNYNNQKQMMTISNGNDMCHDHHQDIISWFEEITEKAGLVQTETLRRILEVNYGVEYLKKWLGDNVKIQELEGCVLESIYTSLVPLSTHADLEPYIQRIADGDTAPILTQQPITTLSLRFVYLLLRYYLHHFSFMPISICLPLCIYFVFFFFFFQYLSLYIC